MTNEESMKIIEFRLKREQKNKIKVVSTRACIGSVIAGGLDTGIILSSLHDSLISLYLLTLATPLGIIPVVTNVGNLSQINEQIKIYKLLKQELKMGYNRFENTEENGIDRSLFNITSENIYNSSKVLKK